MITTLRITKVGDEDNGKYTLMIKNTAGETKAETMLDVMGKPKPPRIIKEIEPAELTIPGKKDIRLTCKIAGFPAPVIKWFRDGNEIKVWIYKQFFNFFSSFQHIKRVGNKTKNFDL